MWTGITVLLSDLLPSRVFKIFFFKLINEVAESRVCREIPFLCQNLFWRDSKSGMLSYIWQYYNIWKNVFQMELKNKSNFFPQQAGILLIQSFRIPGKRVLYKKKKIEAITERLAWNVCGFLFQSSVFKVKLHEVFRSWNQHDLWGSESKINMKIMCS